MRVFVSKSALRKVIDKERSQSSLTWKCNWVKFKRKKQKSSYITLVIQHGFLTKRIIVLANFFSAIQYCSLPIL